MDCDDATVQHATMPPIVCTLHVRVLDKCQLVSAVVDKPA